MKALIAGRGGAGWILAPWVASLRDAHELPTSTYGSHVRGCLKTPRPLLAAGHWHLTPRVIALVY